MRTVPIMLLFAVCVTATASEPFIRYIVLPCQSPRREVVARAVEIFGANGYRIASAFPELGTITAEGAANEGNIFTPVTVSITVAGDSIHIAAYRTGIVGGGQVVLRELDPSIIAPVISALSTLCNVARN